MKKLLQILLPVLSVLIGIQLTANAATFTIERWQTHNGTRVIFYPAKEVPMVDISIAFAAGSAYDGEQFGLSTLTTQLINQGNNGLDANEIAEKLENTGAQFGAENNRDMIVLSLRALTQPDHLLPSIDAFSKIVSHPDFPESAFIRQKNQQLIALKQIKDSPDNVADQQFYQTLYRTHPYGHPVLGDPEHVSAITRDKVQQFYHQYLVGKNSVLVLVGAIDSRRAHQLADKITHDLPAGKIPEPIPSAQPLEKNALISIPFSSSQTVIRLGQMGITHHDPRYFAFLVGNYILGGGSMVSELAIELREKRGLTYGVYSQFAPMPGVGPFIISLSTRNDQAKTAGKLTLNTLKQFINQGPTLKQVNDAKQFLTGGFPLSLASNRSIADILLKIGFYHLPDDYLNTYLSHINAVTMEEIKQAFQALIKPTTLLQVNVGQA